MDPDFFFSNTREVADAKVRDFIWHDLFKYQYGEMIQCIAKLFDLGLLWDNSTSCVLYNGGEQWLNSTNWKIILSSVIDKVWIQNINNN